MDQSQKRLELQKEFEDLLGNKNVYYQPPESLKLKYPCIIYNRNDIENDYANNKPYKREMVYDGLLIEKDPDSDLSLKIDDLPYCSFDRFYITDNLYHGAFRIYY